MYEFKRLQDNLLNMYFSLLVAVLVRFCFNVIIVLISIEKQPLFILDQ